MLFRNGRNRLAHLMSLPGAVLWPQKLLITGLVLGFYLSACNDSTSTKTEEPLELPSSSETSSIQIPDAAPLAKLLVDHAFKELIKTEKSVNALNHSIQQLINAPSEQALQQAQHQWIEAYNAYLELGILNSSHVKTLAQNHSGNTLSISKLYSRVNAWPLLGGYLDSVPGYPQSGIVHDIDSQISRNALIDQHGFSDEYFVTLGFHALEFLLWGLQAPTEDTEKTERAEVRESTVNIENHDTPKTSESNEKAITPRTYKDFIAKSPPPVDEEDEFAPEIEAHQISENRRRSLITLVSEQLLNDIEVFKNRWQPKKGQYALTLEQLSDSEQLHFIVSLIQHQLFTDLWEKQLKPLIEQDFDPELLQSPYSGMSEQHFKSMFYQWLAWVKVTTPLKNSTHPENQNASNPPPPANPRSGASLLQQALNDTKPSLNAMKQDGSTTTAAAPETTAVSKAENQPGSSQAEASTHQLTPQTTTSELENSDPAIGTPSLKTHATLLTKTLKKQNESEQKAFAAYLASTIDQIQPQSWQPFQYELTQLLLSIEQLPEGFMQEQRLRAQPQINQLVKAVDSLSQRLANVKSSMGVPQTAHQ